MDIEAALAVELSAARTIAAVSAKGARAHVTFWHLSLASGMLLRPGATIGNAVDTWADGKAVSTGLKVWYIFEVFTLLL